MTSSNPDPQAAAGRPSLLHWTVTAAGVVYLAVAAWSPTRARLGVPEAIMFVGLLVFNSRAIERLATLSISGGGLKVQLNEVKKEVRQTQESIRVLQWLLAYFASESEFQLLKLLDEPSSVYRWPDDQAAKAAKEDLRALCTRNLIGRRDKKKIADMPNTGDLRDWFRLEARGRSYLGLRQEGAMGVDSGVEEPGPHVNRSARS
jgi:hypothetical protein